MTAEDKKKLLRYSTLLIGGLCMLFAVFFRKEIGPFLSVGSVIIGLLLVAIALFHKETKC